MAIDVLLYYTPQDKRISDKLKEHLAPLVRNNYIAIWDSGNILPGTEWKKEMDTHFRKAQFILLLVSSSFLASSYLDRREAQEAIRQHERKEKQVIPIIIRSAHWNLPPLDKLPSLPDTGKPILNWRNRDAAYTDVTQGISQRLAQWNAHSLPDPPTERKMFIENFDQFVEAVKSQMEPPARAEHVARTLEQIRIFIPNDTTLADLKKGWEILSHSARSDEGGKVANRRTTCGELAKIASQVTDEQGDLKQAINTWYMWAKVFKNHSGDQRQPSMSITFTRELAELEAATSK